MTPSNTQIVEGFYASVARGDIAAATGVFADDLVWVEPPFPGHEGGEFRGKQLILSHVLGPFIATWEGLRLTIDRVTPSTDGAIVHGVYHGAHKETKRPFQARFVHTWTIRDGKAVRFEMLADTVQFFRTVRPGAAGEVPVFARRVHVEGVEVFYREAGRAGAPKLILLHGFPSSSHMFRNLMPALADAFHIFAPDYPGFGLSQMPSPSDFEYSFDRLAEVMASWIAALGISEYILYLQDYGGPIGMRIASAAPQRVRGLIFQNANIYMEGLSPSLAPLSAYMSDPKPETEMPVRSMLTSDTTRFQYTHGVARPEQIEPESWIYDQHFLDRPGNDQIQLALFRDYKTNPPLFAHWQEYLRKHQPTTLVVWGKNDPFFTSAGATKLSGDVPAASIHLLDTGHFALEDHTPEIAALIRSKFAGGTQHRS